MMRQRMEALQAEIDRIERAQPSSFASLAAFQKRSFGSSDASVDEMGKDVWEPWIQSRGRKSSSPWLSGHAEADKRLGAFGLDGQGTHEIKPALAPLPMVSAAAFAAALAFALQLAAQRPLPGQGMDGGWMLFCASCDVMREIGRLYGPGLRALGLDPARLLIVETAKPAETLWAMEEGLKSQALGAVIGCLEGIALTPARRLSLAAKANATPCLFVTDARTPPAGATASRWRVEVRPGRPCPFDHNAPGAGGCEIRLEKLRSRGAGLVAAGCGPVQGGSCP